MMIVGLWFVLQFVLAVGHCDDRGLGRGGTYLAHVGGLLFGLATMRLFASGTALRGAGRAGPGI